MEEKMFEWMVKPTAQKEWIERRGVLLWLAFFFIELGAGLYFCSLFFNLRWGMLVGWLVTAVLGGGTHLLYLGKPLRFWRAFLRPQSSWISRGLLFVVVYVVVGAFHIALLPGLPQAAIVSLDVVMGIVSFLVVIYGGFAMNYIRAIPFWNTPLLPALYVVASFWGGCEVALGLMLQSGDTAMIGLAESLVPMFLLGYILLIGVYIWSMRYGPSAAKQSVREMIRGSLAVAFYAGVIVLGIIVPLSVLIYTYSGSLGTGAVPMLLVIAILSGLIGDLSARYCILKAGIYSPLA